MSVIYNPAAVPSAPAPVSRLEASARGGRATRDGHAKQFKERTGESWFAHIAVGRPPRRRFIPQGDVLVRLSAVASTERASR